ncbi:MAG TPA: hypothetical protein VL284_02760 [Thermoanaerobaculia bacterium]|nr:hypothetical protein [Thermoanaerobaculia bacterium]
MRHRSSAERRGSYVVLLDGPSRSMDELRELAAYLTELALSDFEVVIVDSSESFDRNRQVLRWVGRHLCARPQHLGVFGKVDAIRAAMDVAACDKIIVADSSVRYCSDSLDQVALLLELHEVVEPQDYFDPLPWWGVIEAGRVLVHRSIASAPDHGATFGFQKRAVRGFRSLDYSSDRCVRRLASQGADVFSAMRVFVRRIPPAFSQWLRSLPKQAEEEFAIPVKAALFFMLLPVAIALLLTGGTVLAAAYGGLIAFLAIALAIRGRAGASAFFPRRACLFAPLWILQRSLSIYWALLWRAGGGEPRHVLAPMRAQNEQVATGK